MFAVRRTDNKGGGAYEQTKEGGSVVTEFRDLNNKRVCDVSDDGKTAEIVRKDSMTRISANPDGTLKIESFPVEHTA